MDPYQIWKVTAVESTGKNTALGYHEGYLDAVALKLGTHYRYLYFEPIFPHKLDANDPLAYDVTVSMKKMSNTHTEAEYLRQTLASRMGTIEIHDVDDHCIKIIRRLSPREKAMKELEELLGTTSEEVKNRVMELIKEVYD